MENKYIIDWEKYASLARRAAADGMVLLKNEKEALPLKKGQKLSVFGRIQFDYYKSGSGSGGMVNTRYVVGILDALLEEKDIILNKELDQVYREWLIDHPFDPGKGWAQDPWCQVEMPLETEIVKKAAEFSDTALVVIGRMAGEDRDAQNARGSYLLTETEEDMLQKVRAAFEKVIVVLNVGNIIDMRWVETYQPDAVLYGWQCGMEGGHAVADVLTGRVNPSGKLADTIAELIEDYPSTANFGGAEGDRYVEDIYVGYRYFETFAKEKVLYPFGFGLSYTTFEVNCKEAELEDGKTIFHIEVENTGNVAGKEVVQIYVNPPQGKLGKPVRNLAAYAKTDLLEPGEVQELELEVYDRDFASYDDSGVTGHKSCYVLEEGIYRFYIGTDVRNAVWTVSFEQPEVKVIEKCREALAPVDSFERMKPLTEDGETFFTGYEPVPLRTYSMRERMLADQGEEIPYTGDLGYKLGDVYDGKISMDTFIGQLSEKDLCCIVRGEGVCSPKVTPGIAGSFGGVTDSLKAFGIPCGGCADGPSGIRMDCGTYAFSMPNGTCLACTFDDDLVRELYVMEGAELRKNHIDMLLGPGINIHRNPLNGRNFEYFSEDPLLAGLMAAAQLQGMNTYGVTGTIKHFAANNQEFHRQRTNSVVSERALREIYLKPFEIAVKEGKAYSVMTSYGAINGIWTAGNYDLNTTILRGEWGFEGIVMTDWWADINEEGGEPSKWNAAAMVRSQNDLYMVTKCAEENTTNDNLETSLAQGTLKRSTLQRCAASILAVLMRSPIMDRSLGRISEEELEAEKVMQTEDKVEFDMEYYEVEKSCKIDVSGLDTSKGASKVWGILAKEMGNYSMRMKVKIDASELAQVSMSTIVNGMYIGTISLNGTNGKWIEVEQELGDFLGMSNFVKVFFAESGMQLKDVEVYMKKLFKPGQVHEG